jgi:hypothetical protein
MSSIQPLILTLKFEKSAFELFDCLRKQYFPPARNFIPAHVTLFHRLPGAQESFITQTLAQICAETEQFELEFTKPLFLGKGTAIEIVSPPLISLRQQIAVVFAAGFADALTAQDKQKIRPHVTVQNKVAPEAARLIYNQFSAEWQPFKAAAEGLILWEYQGGPWRFITEFAFAAKEKIRFAKPV